MSAVILFFRKIKKGVIASISPAPVIPANALCDSDGTLMLDSDGTQLLDSNG